MNQTDIERMKSKKGKRYARLVLCKEKRTKKMREKRTRDGNSIHQYDDDYSCCYSACHRNILFHEYLFILDSNISSFYK
jgi:hypothetical protein